MPPKLGNKQKGWLIFPVQKNEQNEIKNQLNGQKIQGSQFIIPNFDSPNNEYGFVIQSDKRPNIKGKTVLFVGNANQQSLNETCNQLQILLTPQANSNRIDLSNLPSHNVRDFSDNSSVILFVASLYAKNAEEISLANNNIQNDQFLNEQNLKRMFPQLKKIDLSGNNVNIKKPPKSIEVSKDGGSTGGGGFIGGDYGNSGGNEGGGSQSIWGYPHPMSYVEIPIIQYSERPPAAPLKNINLKPDLEGSCDNLTLDSFIPCTLDVDAFPTHQFTADFLDTSWRSLNTIGSFYEDEAVFSMSATESFPHSPISSFASNSANWLKPETLFDEDNPKSVEGPARIAFFQTMIFGAGFYAHPTNIHASCIDGNIFMVVIQGAFRDRMHHIFRFTRSLIVRYHEDIDNFRITNDHVFIQTPTHAKLSSFNPSEAHNMISELLDTNNETESPYTTSKL